MSFKEFMPKFQIPKGADRRMGIQHPGMVVWKNPQNEFIVAATHYTADPEKRTAEWLLKATRGMRPDQVEREYEIDFESRAGQKVFWYLAQDPRRWLINDLQPKDIPKNWRIIAALDYGSLNPTSAHIYAIDERRRFTSLYEFYKPAEKGKSITPEIVRFFQGKHKDFPLPKEIVDRIEKIVADPSIFRKNQESQGEEMSSIAEILEDMGLDGLEPGENDRQAGLERVHDMLRFLPETPEEPPYLFFCKRCKMQWKELTALVYDELPPHLLLNKNKKEDVLGKDDHSYDELRYGLMSITAPSSKAPTKQPPPGSLGAIEDSWKADQDGDEL